MSTSYSAGNDAESSHQKNDSSINLTIPTSLLILPTSAALVGLIIGMSRGGSRARLRFLAENAHRQPRTIQGWYFYTKTRNYRVFFAAAKTGTRYALGLGGATAAFVLLDESIGWSREQVFGVPIPTQAPPKPSRGEHEEVGEEERISTRKKRVGWRVGGEKWEDGAIAGTVMGAVVGTAYSLPRPLFLRSVFIGTILGGAASALQMAQDHIGRLRDQEATSTSSSSSTSTTAPSSSSLSSTSTSTSATSSLPQQHNQTASKSSTTEPPRSANHDHPIVDRPLEPGLPLDSSHQEQTEVESLPWWDLRKWIIRK